MSPVYNPSLPTSYCAGLLPRTALTWPSSCGPIQPRRRHTPICANCCINCGRHSQPPITSSTLTNTTCNGDRPRALAQVEQAEQAQDTAALRQALEQAANLYRGDLLPSCYDEWILPERDRLHLLFLQSAERLIALLDQERDYTAAIALAQRLLRHDPLHESTHRQLMHFYALRGDRAAALRVYHTGVTALERELAAELGEATRQAY